MESWRANLHPAQIAAYRRMTPQEKIDAARDLNRTSRVLKEAWLRKQHPEWSDDRVAEELRTIFLYATTG